MKFAKVSSGKVGGGAAVREATEGGGAVGDDVVVADDGEGTAAVEDGGVSWGSTVIGCACAGDSEGESREAARF